MTLEEEVKIVKDNYNVEYRDKYPHSYGKFNSRGILVARNKLREGYKPIYNYVPPYNPETQYSKIIGYVEMDDCIIYASIIIDYETEETDDQEIKEETEDQENKEGNEETNNNV